MLNLVSESLNFTVRIALSKDICGTTGTSGTTVVETILFPYIFIGLKPRDNSAELIVHCKQI